MLEDEEGFLSPVIDETLCIECRKCLSVCPMEKAEFYPAQENCFACFNADEEARFKSSSGALFPLFTNYVIKKNGYVCGVISDENLVTRHVIFSKENSNELYKLYGSKYVQSVVGDVFSQIRKLLKFGELVLFSGCPCQVAGLKSFLGKEYDNLFTIDIICHGVPSPGVLNLYLKETCSNFPKLTNVTFRDKVFGWNCLRFSVKDENWNTYINERGGENPYLKAFIKNACLRKSCYVCPFARQQRVGDVTLGDFWNIKDISKNFSDNRGTSIVICNTEKGKKVFSAIEKFLYKCEQFRLKDAKNGCLKHPTSASPKREIVFELYRYYSKNNKIDNPLGENSSSSFSNELSRLFIPVGILNFFDADNFGASIVPYAMCHMLSQLGYQGEIINYRKSKSRFNQNPLFEQYRQKFLPMSPEGVSDLRYLKSVMRRYKNIITGSDQVFRMRQTDTYMLDWVSGSKNLISYAASFGTSDYTGNIPVEKASNLLRRFNAVSVREKDGLDICKKWGVDAVQVCDPVIMLDAKDYQPIIDSDVIRLPQKEYVGVIYFGDARKRLLKDKSIAKDIKSRYPLVNILRDSGGQLRSVSNYLELIKNAKFILTNSFHGLVLSIVFKKKFLTGYVDDTSRQHSLLSSLGIPLERLVMSLEDINLNILKKEIDYELVYRNLDILRHESMVFLRNALSKSYSPVKNHKVSMNLYFNLNDSKFEMKLIYDNDKKIYDIDEYDTVYEVSQNTAECFINNMRIEKRYDANICNKIFSLLEKNKIEKIPGSILKLNKALVSNSSLLKALYDLKRKEKGPLFALLGKA